MAPESRPRNASALDDKQENKNTFAPGLLTGSGEEMSDGAKNELSSPMAVNELCDSVNIMAIEQQARGTRLTPCQHHTAPSLKTRPHVSAYILHCLPLSKQRLLSPQIILLTFLLVLQTAVPLSRRAYWTCLERSWTGCSASCPMKTASRCALCAPSLKRS